MRTAIRLIAVASAALTLAVASPAQSPAADAASARADRFAPFEFLAGGTWTVVDDVPGAAGGVVTEYEFAFVLDRKFLQSRHAASRDGKVLSSSISFLGWDAAKNGMAQWGFNNTGLTAVMHVLPGAAPGAFTLEGRLGSSERAPTIRSSYRQVGDHELEVRTEVLRNGEYAPLGTVRLRRSPPHGGAAASN